MELPIKLLHPAAQMPTRGTEYAAGLDPIAILERAVNTDWSGRSVFVQEAISVTCNQLRKAIDSADEQRARQLAEWLVNHF